MPCHSSRREWSGRGNRPGGGKPPRWTAADGLPRAAVLGEWPAVRRLSHGRHSPPATRPASSARPSPGRAPRPRPPAKLACVCQRWPARSSTTPRTSSPEAALGAERRHRLERPLEVHLRRRSDGRCSSSASPRRCPAEAVWRRSPRPRGVTLEGFRPKPTPLDVARGEHGRRQRSRTLGPTDDVEHALLAQSRAIWRKRTPRPVWIDTQRSNRGERGRARS